MNTEKKINRSLNVFGSDCHIIIVDENEKKSIELFNFHQFHERLYEWKEGEIGSKKK